MIHKVSVVVLFYICTLGSSIVYANQVSIINAELESQSGLWVVRVTLQHIDKGWEHYADVWRIVANDGTILAERILSHPHVDEQPFTRNLSGVQIPASTKKIYIEAHDNVHGWGKEKLLIDMSIAKGKDYQIRSH
ncbi:MAG: hypothetical protein OEY89_12160 [Gammaproteobacteria bacterium]|nr:hypothetical protein [Gammaproteobacteria bacterium]